ncbi:uncharacterized protein Bfra_004892 [Botrytis fragariae]|uniref:Uncharacterized protein n=1 Tax=Botrytis fragariae TaxID=1964551 RepID=A0A8H6ATP1_9HELO|nr:uncharacterized protein Bfra_004892 [Botrytis fragariae]KAF5873432.1 hypothetical protein Bfra_004892 [Botrytis fragariae]
MSRVEIFFLPSLDTPRSHALWTKLRVLSHHWDRNCTLTYDNEPIVVNNFSNSLQSLSPEQLMMWNQVEPANFKAVGMTLRGTVVFRDSTYYVLADQRALETGMILSTEFENYGAPGNRMRDTNFRTYLEYF